MGHITTKPQRSIATMVGELDAAKYVGKDTTSLLIINHILSLVSDNRRNDLSTLFQRSQLHVLFAVDNLGIASVRTGDEGMRVAHCAVFNNSEAAVRAIGNMSVALLTDKHEYTVAHAAVASTESAALKILTNPDLTGIKGPYGKTLLYFAVQYWRSVAEEVVNNHPELREIKDDNRITVRQLALQEWGVIPRSPEDKAKLLSDALRMGVEHG